MSLGYPPPKGGSNRNSTERQTAVHLPGALKSLSGGPVHAVPGHERQQLHHRLPDVPVGDGGGQVQRTGRLAVTTGFGVPVLAQTIVEAAEDYEPLDWPRCSSLMGSQAIVGKTP